jgi:hypothetical protein
MWLSIGTGDRQLNFTFHKWFKLILRSSFPVGLCTSGFVAPFCVHFSSFVFILTFRPCHCVWFDHRCNRRYWGKPCRPRCVADVPTIRSGFTKIQGKCCTCCGANVRAVLDTAWYLRPRLSHKADWPCHYFVIRSWPLCCVTFYLSVKRKRKLYSVSGDWSIVCVSLAPMPDFYVLPGSLHRCCSLHGSRLSALVKLLHKCPLSTELGPVC